MNNQAGKGHRQWSATDEFREGWDRVFGKDTKEFWIKKIETDIRDFCRQCDSFEAPKFRPNTTDYIGYCNRWNENIMCDSAFMRSCLRFHPRKEIENENS